MAERRTRDDRLNAAIEAAAQLHPERLSYLREDVTRPVRELCGLDGAPVDPAEWLAERVNDQRLIGDRMTMYAPASSALTSLRTVMMESWAVTPSQDLAVRLKSFGQRIPAGWRIEAFTGASRVIRVDLTRPGFGVAGFMELVSASKEAGIQPLARMSLAALAVELLTLASAEEALWFVMADVEPPFRPLSLREIESYPPLPGRFAVADAWMTSEQIGALVARYRARPGSVGGHIIARKRVRRPSPDLDDMIRFVEERRPGEDGSVMPWSRVLVEWRAESKNVPDEWTDDHMRKSYWRAVKVRENKQMRTRQKGGETT